MKSNLSQCIRVYRIKSAQNRGDINLCSATKSGIKIDFISSQLDTLFQQSYLESNAGHTMKQSNSYTNEIIINCTLRKDSRSWEKLLELI